MEKDKLNLIISDLNNGFISDKLTIYTEQSLFGEELKLARKKNSKNFFKDYSKLSLGDFVVHEKHGIAIFDGLVNLDVAGISHDFILLRYQNNDKLYIPIENINLISRYGNAESNVQLDYLKSNAWINRKQKVHKKLLVIANDLVQLAAKRKMQKTKPFEIPDDYEKFCRGFGHIETEDQLSAIDDVIGDLTSDTPMDRLICGDVGFGKTEVALRASFIVSSSLRQVVLLAPTTILVLQHYKNFQKRFKDFGIEICQLSRFVPKARFQQSLADIKSGKVQIIIATHAILSERIEFADLGLVIIDEEQHFGVKQKEFLKKHHETTHFMTLSATPIPRTLQLAMSGVKELSMITTPPTDRLPVKTLVHNYNNEILKQAIEHETKIGGQVFVVTPRIEFLDAIYEHISKLFPELRIAKAHGKTAILEEILSDFCDGSIDVLISTNVIDSGIDIPNANTILIHRFDLFGLSQLYQLRGRVGRSKRQAYAYLLLDEARVLSDTAKKRLEVLENLNKLGAGFSLASYDLDIRGAGNLLGEEQSGYIKEVGVELYQSMLQEAILMLKSGHQGQFSNKHEVQINLGVPALIPEYYINDSALRLEMYRRIGSLDTETAVDAMEY
ncbi:MAG: DEAD/DEAH box helicase, partial [Alphaproteobacteria bacterium]|nr:DEAD/DEAH box helicase [Alphaproteobacteria bacterium]